METVSQKKAKPGRPKQTVKKDARICVRFDRQEYFILKEKADLAGATASEYVRQTCISAKITSRISKEEMHFVRQLAGMAVNINQVARVCHREGLYEAMRYFEDYRKELDQVMQKLRS